MGRILESNDQKETAMESQEASHPMLSRRELLGAVAATAVAGALPLDPVMAQAVRVIHVDPEGGDDACDGQSPETARRTPPSPEALEPGDRVLFKGGTRLRETLEISRGGTAEAPVVYDGNSRGEWGEGPAILDGSEPLANCRPCGDLASLWQTDRPEGAVTDLLIHQGDQAFALAQLPEPKRLDQPEDVSTFQRADAEWREELGDGKRTSWLECPAMFGPEAGDLTQGALVRLHVYGNFVRTYPITDHDPARGVVRLGPDAVGGESGPPDVHKSRLFALVNTRAGLRRPGQFVVEDDRLVMHPHADPAQTPFDVARLHGGVFVSADHVDVRGFRVEKLRAGEGIRGRNGSSGRVRGLRVVGNEVCRSRTSRGIWFERCDDSIAYGNHVHDLPDGRGLLANNSQRSSFVKNRSERIAGTCLSVYGGQDCKVIGNRIGDPLGVHSNGMSFYMGNRGTQVLFNTVMIPEAAAFAMTMQDAGEMLVAFNTLVSRDFASFSHHPDKGYGGGEIGGHVWLNNLVLTTEDDRAFRMASTKAREGSILANNIADGFVVDGVEPFAFRSSNVYTRRRSGTGLSLSTMEAIGEYEGDRDAMFRDVESWDLRPSEAWRETLAAGSPFMVNGVRVDWIGRYRPDGSEAWDWDADGAP